MRINRKSQAGMTTVEFAVIGGVFFLVLFAVIEFSRLMFVLNTLDEVTRRGARLAAVCPVDDTSKAFVQNRAIFDGNVIPGITASKVKLEYLDDDGGLVGQPETDLGNFLSIRYVRASIDDYQHQMLIPTLGITIPVPDFSTTIPSESLGVHPDGSSASCS